MTPQSTGSSTIWDVHVRTRLGDGRRAFSLDVAWRSSAGRLVLYGPSGAGKTQTLHAIAGLTQPQHGFVRLHGETLFDSGQGVHRSPQSRRVAYMFQDYALFPHLNVAQNIAFGLHRGWVNPARGIRHPAVTRWIEAFELAAVAQRHPHELSGGQRQRTALARALVAQPRALLLDEPFAALDTALRERLRDELDRLLRGLDLPLVLITHDRTDVERFADEVVHLADGRIVRHDTVAAPMGLALTA